MNHQKLNNLNYITAISNISFLVPLYIANILKNEPLCYILFNSAIWSFLSNYYENQQNLVLKNQKIKSFIKYFSLLDSISTIILILYIIYILMVRNHFSIGFLNFIKFTIFAFHLRFDFFCFSFVVLYFKFYSEFKSKNSTNYIITRSIYNLIFYICISCWLLSSSFFRDIEISMNLF